MKQCKEKTAETEDPSKVRIKRKKDLKTQMLVGNSLISFLKSGSEKI